MKLALPMTALVLLACSTSEPRSSATESSVGSSAEALRKLGQLDADDVQRCRDAASRCASGNDSGANPFCERISDHCDALEAQLAEDRAELEQCLQEAAACEAAASDPAECADARAACEPADGNFRARRGRTFQCADRAEQCLAAGAGFGRGFGFGRRRAAQSADTGDAGAPTCDADATDFVGCCHGHGGGADAGVPGFGQLGGRRGPFGGPQGRGPGVHHDRDADDGAPDAGAQPFRGRRP